MRIFNSASRSLEVLEPSEGNRVGMYTCGPTVYDFAHIGNLRTFLFEDLLRRYLVFCGYDVTQVMNLTDVDDKTIRAAREAGKSLDEYTRVYKDAFFEDLQALNVRPADAYPCATAHIPQMVEMIARLVEKGFGYVAEDGSVYFSIEKDAGYGRLVNLDRDQMRRGERVEHDEYEKEGVADFALWKAWKEEDGDVAWDSPWGRGRPGWHIECSAMSMAYLGESFDLHTGGVDNRFPHHEDEIAQSEGATGKPFVRYWMHSNFLLVENKKMSKSAGNFYTLRDLLGRGHSARAIRYALLNAHYRQLLNFTIAGLDQAAASLDRLDTFNKRLEGLASGGSGGELPKFCNDVRSEFVAAMDDDLNLPGAIAAIFRLATAGNRAMDEDVLDANGADAILGLLRELDEVLGFLRCEADAPDRAVQALMEQREVARGAKDWAEADRLRDEIESMGWTVKDTSDGAQLHRK